MQMLYNSDSYAVVLFEVQAEAAPGAAAATASADPKRGGYEIVDKFLGKEIFISGTLAESFKTGVEALIRTSPSEEEIDDYIERFSALMQQPLVLH
ncbi:MAG: DUF3567 domain-containing protein [Caldimonas sp.]